MSSLSDKKIKDSWFQNAKPWVSAIQNDEIESRLLITNKAIVETISQKEPKKVLDIGCGEGWLARALSDSNINILGVDVVPELINEARKKGSGKFEVLAYEDFSKERFSEKFDIIVCNFSLLGDQSVIQIFKIVSDLLNKNGCFIIQTIHPIEGCGDHKYEDGWRKGSWAGFSNNFTNPPPWYFRTLETWKELFSQNNFNHLEIIEPINPNTKKVASIIFVGKITNSTNN